VHSIQFDAIAGRITDRYKLDDIIIYNFIRDIGSHSRKRKINNIEIISK